MARAFLVVMDSVGIGGAPDAAAYFNGDVPDTGANTLAHIAQACADGLAEDGRSGPLNVPTLVDLGLAKAVELASEDRFVGDHPEPSGFWAAATEVSKGKDTPSGHWELAGVPVPWGWHYFANTSPAFPDAVTKALCKAAGTNAILANEHASGTEVIERLGAEHLRTGYPICYTSVDSVVQIAAHEDAFGLSRLMDMCQAVAPLLHGMKVGRVIARPFLGDVGSFKRTANRKDFAIDPPSPTLCDWASDAGRTVHAIGKIGDIFSGRGITDVIKGRDADLMDALKACVKTADAGSFTFANFVEFDSEYGHRRDVSGYARALEWFDRELGQILTTLGDGDLLIVTADHGNDPTWVGTDHTRERVPVLVHGAGTGSGGLIGFSDVATTIGAHLGIPALGSGRNFL